MYTLVSEPGAQALAERPAEEKETTYHFRIYKPRCETYAIRLSGCEVTGVCGPLEYDEVLFRSLPDFPYTDLPDCVSWVQENYEDFVLCDVEYDEGMVWI